MAENSVKVATVQLTAPEVDVVASALTQYAQSIKRAIAKEGDGQIVQLRNQYMGRVIALTNRIVSKELV